MLRRGSAARRRRRAGGQALVEFALVATVMALLMGGLAQFGMIFERQIGINNAVREAARRGAALATPDGTTAAANAAWTLGQLQTLLGNSQTYDATAARNLQVCFDTPAPPNDEDPAGNKQVVVTVTAGYEHPLFLPLIAGILDGLDGSRDNAFYLATSSTFRVEQSEDTPSVDIGSGTCVTP